ncbi:MAG: NAD(P)-dependent oxidoreductase [Rikenellaceae bacterium]
MKKIVIAGDMLDAGFASLVDKFIVVRPPKGRDFTREELFEEIKDADALLAFFTAKVDKELIDKGEKLKIIANFGVGYDKIDWEYAAEKGIVVTNTPDPVTIPTAELAMGLMLDISRKIAFLDREMRNNENYKWDILSNLGVTLHGKTLGIFGMGRIGKEVAKRAQSFGMKIIYHNRTQLASVEQQSLGAKYVSFEELLQQSDFLSINAPSTPQTRGVFTLESFKLMKPTSIVVNTARGDLIKEQDLIFALKNNIIRGAALDVYEQGDGNISKELFELDNVVLVPHIGTQTVDARIEMGLYSSENIILFFEGKKPLSQVN